MAGPATHTFGTVLSPTDFIVGRMLGFPLMQRSFAAIALQTADCAQDESPLSPAPSRCHPDQGPAFRSGLSAPISAQTHAV